MRTVVWEGFLEEKAPEPDWEGARGQALLVSLSAGSASQTILQGVLVFSTIQI